AWSTKQSNIDDATPTRRPRGGGLNFNIFGGGGSCPEGLGWASVGGTPKKSFEFDPGRGGVTPPPLPPPPMRLGNQSIQEKRKIKDRYNSEICT
ncbi:MAG: hypothetical protein GY820_00055, partial [Gammaproteobacteria bacterium]|nr:hypothetical protein [Gammaproteobacteria bacterium]